MEENSIPTKTIPTTKQKVEPLGVVMSLFEEEWTPLKKSSSGESTTLFSQLPRDVLMVLFSFLPLQEHLAISQCCKDLYTISVKNEFWMILLSHNMHINRNVNKIFQSYHRKAKRGRLNQFETNLINRSGSEFIKFIHKLDFSDDNHLSPSDDTNRVPSLDEKFCLAVRGRAREAITDELKDINYKRQYVDLMKNYSEAQNNRKLRMQEKTRRQNRLFTVASVTFLFILLAFMLISVFLGLFLDNTLPKTKYRHLWLVPFMPLGIVILPVIAYCTLGFPIAIKWNPFYQQNYFKTLSKHTKNFFVLSLAHFWWIPLLALLILVKMFTYPDAPTWSFFMIPVYAWWAGSVISGVFLSLAVVREQRIEIRHLKGLVVEHSDENIKQRKIDRALQCARAKISCAITSTSILFLSYICLFLTCVFSLRKYDATIDNRPASKSTYSVLFIPIYLMIFSWIVSAPIILRHIVYIILGSPTPAKGMDFFALARLISVAISTMCTELIVIPAFISSILLALRIDGFIKIMYIWVFSPVYCTLFFLFTGFGLLYAYLMCSVIRSWAG